MVVVTDLQPVQLKNSSTNYQFNSSTNQLLERCACSQITRVSFPFQTLQILKIKQGSWIGQMLPSRVGILHFRHGWILLNCSCLNRPNHASYCDGAIHTLDFCTTMNFNSQILFSSYYHRDCLICKIINLTYESTTTATPNT